jgi:hypothetical protein
MVEEFSSKNLLIQKKLSAFMKVGASIIKKSFMVDLLMSLAKVM